MAKQMTQPVPPPYRLLRRAQGEANPFCFHKRKSLKGGIGYGKTKF